MTIWNPEVITRSSTQNPKYKVLADTIEMAIESAELTPGDKLPTHRNLADILGVTVGTVTRGYAEAERRNLIESKVGSGTYVLDKETPRHQLFYRFDEVDDSIVDMSYSTAISINQEQLLIEELGNIQKDPALIHQLLAYHPEYGMEHHREAGARWLQDCGFNQIKAEQILISCGAQHGFFNTLLALTRRGDTVLAEGLSYPGYIAACQQLGLKLMGLETDEFGLTPESLLLACQRHKPRVLYLMTRMSNPSSVVMPRQRIDELADICRQYQIIIIEDDVQGSMSDPNSPSFTGRHPDITVLITSLSKAIAGGLRVGYIKPPAQYFKLIGNALRASNWLSPPLMAEIASRWIMSGQAAIIMERQKVELRKRHALVRDKLNYPAVHHERCLNVWLQLPAPWRAQNFAAEAEAKGVLVKTSELFSAGQFAAPQAIRFCLGGDLSMKQLDNAITIFNEILAATPSMDFTS